MPIFEYYDASSRPGFSRLRMTIEKWVSRIPIGERQDLISRLRSRRDQDFSSALMELIAHETLIALGYAVQKNPILEGTNDRPDLLVMNKNGEPLFYVEVTTEWQPEETSTRNRKIAPIRDAIDRCKTPGDTRFSLREIQVGISNPKISRLISHIERWARENASKARAKETVRNVFCEQGWKVDLVLLAGFKTNPKSRRIAVSSQLSGTVSGPESLRHAAEIKAKKYRNLRLPYVVVVGCKSTGASWVRREFEEVVTEAIWGDEFIETVSLISGGYRTRGLREKGVLQESGAPRNKHVSAVWCFAQSDLWHLADIDKEPILFLNHVAQHPLNPRLLPVKRLFYKDDKIKRHEGKRLSDILKIRSLFS